MARALKVFRTSTGFHDAYVAAPSRKAALEAWGSEHDLFARGVAEQVTDPALIEEPLAHPGTVIKRLRGSEAEQIAALPPDAPRRPRKPDTKSPKQPEAKAKPPERTPRPTRETLDAAEQALADAERDYADRRADLRRQEEQLAKQRRALDAGHEREMARLAKGRDKAEAAYDRAMKAWRG